MLVVGAHIELSQGWKVCERPLECEQLKHGLQVQHAVVICQ